MSSAANRFWHGLRRMVRRAHSATRELLPKPRTNELALDVVRVRLQHYLRATYGEALPIEPLALSRPMSRSTRVLQQLRLLKRGSSSESDELSIRLPATLAEDATGPSALDHYRMLAVQHAERKVRRSALGATQATSDLERDLYHLVETAAIDRSLIETQPGLSGAVSAARASAMALRPRARWRTDLELDVERMIRATFDASPDVETPPATNTAQSSADWARRTAAALEARHGRKSAQSYRRASPITLWNTSVKELTLSGSAQALETQTGAVDDVQQQDTPRSASQSSMPGPSSARSSQGREGGKSPDQSQSDVTSSTRDTGQTDGESPDGSPGNPTDAETSSTNEGRDEGQNSSPQEVDSSPSDEWSGATSGIRHSETPIAPTQLADAVTFAYPEWDTYNNAFHPIGTTVRVVSAPSTSSDWPVKSLNEHMPLVHLARQQFERLRSNRLRLRRQVHGDDLDLEACVASMIEKSVGRAPSDRLYTMVRPGRRELAITLLIDTSGSTQDIVQDDQRAIDVERVAALIATAAFDALGDDYSILAFSSRGHEDVRVNVVKEFGDGDTASVRQRIGGLNAVGTTRLGAAVRHATAQLIQRPAAHRLLLILSDGKPYDWDWYFVDYAIEDSRRAVMDARREGIHPFCITVDREEGGEYLAEIFGAAGYLMVRKPSELPRALLGAVQRLLA